MTRIGEFRHKIIFQTGTLTSDGMGGGTTTWTDTVTMWAAIWPLSAREALENLKTEHRVSHRIRCYYSDDITPKQRIKYGTRYFEIVSLINPDESNIELEILAEEIAD